MFPKIKKSYMFVFAFVLFLYFLNSVIALSYVGDIYFTVPSTVYMTGERIELKGFVNQTVYFDNGTFISSGPLVNKQVNITIINKDTNIEASNVNLTTDTSGSFYSKSNFFVNAKQVTAPLVSGSYYIKASYIDLNNQTWFSESEISILNESVDSLRVSSQKSSYNPSETMVVEVEAIRMVGDRVLYIANTTVNGSLRDANKVSLINFSCVTGSNGKCTVSLSAPTDFGDYILEIENFKAFGSFSVVPFSYNINMKDEFGESLKNVFSLSDGARLEVKINNASNFENYSFMGYIQDSSGNNVKIINSTVLNNANSFINSFYFTVDALSFSHGAYTAYVVISKIGDGSINTTTSFEVQDWTLSINKKDSGSGFEYEYSCFTNKTLRFEAYPTYRGNGSIVSNSSSNLFSISLKDNLNNIVSSANATWNSSCGSNGCYEFNITSPLNSGQYSLFVSLSFGTSTQTESRLINVVDGAMSAQSTDKDGNIKELYGTNEYAYITLSAYNLTTSSFNLSNAEIFIVSYMNGSEFSYNSVSNFGLVNSSNSIYEWAWNSSLQRIKLDVPRAGGLYDVYIYGNNRTLGATAKFIVNPYDVCSVGKNTPGQVTSGSSYYVWQFQTADTIYFEIKLAQANNPLGKAIALNISSGNGTGTGIGSACSIDKTKQVVNNASLNLLEVKNLESGAIQNINLSESVCVSSDSNGTYTCTLKPLSKWEGGENIVKINVMGLDGTNSDIYTRFEARAFYLYGWSNTYQNNPSSNISLYIQMYQAGNGWWGGMGSRGLSGSVSVKKVEYQGRDGEWLWPPVDSGYNVSLLNSTTISGSNGNINLVTSNMPGGVWKTGYYRVLLQGTTSSGDTDYGYAWFSVKLWDAYGYPMECTSSACNYKSYFNSRDNVTLYIQIAKAGDNWWNNYNGQGSIWGNTSVGIKKISDCRSWPCRDLNSSQYIANTIYVNASSPYYYYNNLSNNASKYIIQINSTSGSWNTGYYNVVLNINGTDTGYAWFNTIAFYVDTRPVNSTGFDKYSIRGNQAMYFNISTTKDYKWNYYGGNSYNSTDYVNVTLDSLVLRSWDYTNQKTIEYNYPTDLNVTPLSINGTGRINVTYNNGTWPTSYYYGELTLKNSLNESSSGWLYFNVQPFRVQINSNSYNLDETNCINGTLYIYDPDWNTYSILYGNYSVTSVYEDIWNGNGGYTRTIYSNFSSTSFNATSNFTVCPDSSGWGLGSWGGYHSLSVMVKDNVFNDSQQGWVSFRSVPFQSRWNNGNGYLGAINSGIAINASVSLTNPITNMNASGNLSSVYQWRYDSDYYGRENYIFAVLNYSGASTCYSNVSGSCFINGTKTVVIYPPSSGWRIGYNYLYSEFTKSNSASSTITDYNGVYFDGRESYSGSFDNYDVNGNWKYYFLNNENITIKLSTKDINGNIANVNITGVSYSYPDDSCGGEYCRSYSDVVYSPTFTSNGSAILKLKVPDYNWTKGVYYIKARVLGPSGVGTILGGSVRVRDFTAPNITLISPINNGTYGNSLLFSATTSKNAQCTIYFVSYSNFYNWYCSSIMNSTNSSSGNLTTQVRDACNQTKFGFNGTNYFTAYFSNNYYSAYDGNTSLYVNGNYLTTGGTSHSYNVSILNWTSQSYGMQMWCYDSDYNYANTYAAFRVNNTG